MRVLGAAVVRKREGLNVAVGNEEIDRLTLYHFSSAPLPETQIHAEGWIGEYEPLIGNFSQRNQDLVLARRLRM